MKLEHVDTVNESTTYSIELSRAEDIAENGEMADIKTIALPSYFNPDNEDQWVKMLEQLKPHIEEGNFDTVLLKREVYEEKVFTVN
ncbi:hypothetical protein [Lysinibacillus sp. Bpr_S20]|uniref:hypothetical protein n=1 Tax=Lysinibacillus sp. Bpr_S20 TaxID=2933964 RepID=UPI002012346D|nr:hypothetical protein [Lysinibacillus sp. Bpr_S20]MCL1700741.1 hypothetical protein [Lysinibacillus sp. Bpr_S20]